MPDVTSFNEVWGRPAWRDPPEIQHTVGALVAYAKDRFPDNDFVVFDDERLTFREADERSSLLARRLLAAGVGKGARIGVLLPNTPAFMVSYLALARIGAVAVPISTLSTAAELLHVVRHADLHLLIAADKYLNHDYAARCEEAFPGLGAPSRPLFLADAPFLREIWIWGENVPPWAQPADLDKPSDVSPSFLAAAEAEVTASDVAVIIYTSGSTAAPKGVIHSHGALLRQVKKLYSHFPYSADDRIFAPQPFFWVGGLVMNALHVMLVGAAVLGSAETGSLLLDFIERQGATYVHAYPHVARALAGDPSFPQRDFSAMRGGRLIEAIPERLRPKNQTFANALGMTETCGPHTISYFDVADDLRGSLGTPMPGMEHRIESLDTRQAVEPGEAGELLVRGDTLMLGMVKRDASEVFRPDGWYCTGDLCSFRDGHLFFHGRVDDMIKTAGANVSPPEIENMLRGFPGVSQAYVYGVPDDVRGSLVGAIVVPEVDAQIDVEAVRIALAKRVSSYKVPKIILVMTASEIPIMSSSKVDRRSMVRILSDFHARRGVRTSMS